VAAGGQVITTPVGVAYRRPDKEQVFTAQFLINLRATATE